MSAEFTTDDIAITVEIRGVYDGIAVFLLKDGTFINRFRQAPGWSAHRIQAADEWITANGAAFRTANADLLDGSVS